VIGKMFSSTAIVERALDASWLRNEAISQNIANVNTPNYKRKEVKFEEYLNDALYGSKLKGVATNPKHIPIGTNNVNDIPVSVSEDNSNYSMRLDGNNVDIENEMAAMASNAIRYYVMMEGLSNRFNSISTVLSSLK